MKRNIFQAPQSLSFLLWHHRLITNKSKAEKRLFFSCQDHNGWKSLWIVSYCQKCERSEQSLTWIFFCADFRRKFFYSKNLETFCTFWRFFSQKKLSKKSRNFLYIQTEESKTPSIMTIFFSQDLQKNRETYHFQFDDFFRKNWSLRILLTKREKIVKTSSNLVFTQVTIFILTLTKSEWFFTKSETFSVIWTH